MSEKRPKRIGLRRWWVSLLLLVALAADVRVVLDQSRHRGAGGPGWIATVASLEPREWSGEAVTHDLYIVRAKQLGDSPRSLDPESDSWWELGGLVESDQDRLMHVTFQAAQSRRGAWAATRERITASMEFEPYRDGAFSAAEMIEARLLAAARFGQTDGGRWGPTAVRAAGGAVEWSRLLWLGYLHDAASLGATIGFVWSLGWVPRTVAAVRDRRGKQRLAAGRCPGCGYELRGLAAGVCPECGTQVPAAAAGGQGT